MVAACKLSEILLSEGNRSGAKQALQDGLRTILAAYGDKAHCVETLFVHLFMMHFQDGQYQEAAEDAKAALDVGSRAHSADGSEAPTVLGSHLAAFKEDFLRRAAEGYKSTPGDLEQYAALSVARAEASYYCTLCALRLALQSAGGLAPDELEALTEDLVQGLQEMALGLQGGNDSVLHCAQREYAMLVESARREPSAAAVMGRLDAQKGLLAVAVDQLGRQRLLQQQDLFLLPADLEPGACGQLLWARWQQDQAAASAQGRQPSLLRTLVSAYGRPFFWLAPLKFGSDALNFAGPLLLNALLRHLSRSPSEGHSAAGPAVTGSHEIAAYSSSWGWQGCSGLGAAPLAAGGPSCHVVIAARASGFLGQNGSTSMGTYNDLIGIGSSGGRELWWKHIDESSPAFGYACVALLVGSLVLKAILGGQYSYRMELVAAKIRAAVTTTVFRKSLAINSATLAQLGTGRVQTLMSVDADRVVNLCTSFFELISLPLQIAIALWLLYTQVQYAFLAGLAVVLLLIPANRWLAMRIKTASVAMMGAKDRRVGGMMEVLRGIRQIKAYAWEPFFVKQVEVERRAELKALAVRKYMDALCVYCWAATSLLFRVVEAFVSLGRVSEFLAAPEATPPHQVSGPSVSAAAPPPPANSALLVRAREGRHTARGLGKSEASGGHGGSLAVIEKAEVGPAGQPPLPAGIVAASQTGSDAEGAAGSAGGCPGAVAAAPKGYNKNAAVAGEGGFAIEIHNGSFSWGLEGPLQRTPSGRAPAEGTGARGRGSGGSGPRAPVAPGAAAEAVAGGEDVSGASHLEEPLLSSEGGGRGSPESGASGYRGSYASRGKTGTSCSAGDSASGVGSDSGSGRGGMSLQRSTQGSSGLEAGSVPSRGCVLAGLELEVPRGALVAVTGEVGAGKSSLLAAILGELHQRQGSVDVQGSVAYVSQEPWIQSGTVRENILFGAPMERHRYQQVVRACALDHDLHAMPAGDLSPVGDAGSRLSGGQRARLALARALYQDKDIYLLDDVLAAVDAHVASWLTHHALLGPLLRGKTVLILTHSRALLAAASMVLHMGRGGTLQIVKQQQVADSGPARQAAPAVELEAAGAAAGTAGTAGCARQAPAGAQDWNGQPLHPGRHVEGEASLETLKGEAEQEEEEEEEKQLGHAEEGQEADQEERASGHVRLGVYVAYMRATGWGWVVLILASLALMQATRNGNDLWLSYWVSHTPTPAQLPHHRLPSQLHLQPEQPQQHSPFLGQPTPTTIWPDGGSSIQALGGNHALGAAGVLPAAYGRLDPEVRYYLGVLMAIAGANTVFTLARAFSFAKGGMVAATHTHERLLEVVVRLPAAFFDATPGGRVLNRFSSDTATVDDSLPFMLNILLANIASLTGVAAVLLLTQPMVLALLLPLGIVYRYLQCYYRATSRELRRLGALARSPVYTAFSEALSGGPTIRAFGAQQRFLQDAEAAVGSQQRVSLASLGASNWLNLRLQLMAAALAGAVAGLAVLQHQGLLPVASHRMAAGMLGLSLAYVFPITGLLNSLLVNSAETEQEMVSMERLLQYMVLQPQPDTAPHVVPNIYLGNLTAPAAQPPPVALPELQASSEEGSCLNEPLLQLEEGESISVEEGTASTADRYKSVVDKCSSAERPHSSPPGPGWIQQGYVVFDDVWLRYNPAGPDVLQGLSLDFPPGTRLGICGRTGAGKSSLIACLLRLTELTAGRITIDGRDIARVPLRRLRSEIGMVPQAPFIFQGSVRQNLDPYQAHTESELATALRDVQLWDTLNRLQESSSSSSSGGSRDVRAQQSSQGSSLPAYSGTASPPSGDIVMNINSSSTLDTAAAQPSNGVLGMHLGEGGLGLSLGQQQLLCLARVLLRRPRLLCLDECTASVDPATAATMHKVIHDYFQGTTVIEVAHRLGSVMASDQIAVMEAGQVVEQGSPKELLKDPGSAFGRMVREQAGQQHLAAS
ncbi:hypothetical protein N2152v2_003629 [Parachlorella kessleri]